MRKRNQGTECDAGLLAWSGYPSLAFSAGSLPADLSLFADGGLCVLCQANGWCDGRECGPGNLAAFFCQCGQEESDANQAAAPAAPTCKNAATQI